MFTRVVTLSPQGQITIPRVVRRQMKGRKFLFEYKDGIILLKPCRIMITRKNSGSAFLEKILTLTDDQKTVFNLVRQSPCSTDFLYEKTKFGIPKIMIILTELEFQELIEQNREMLWSVRDDLLR